MAQLTHGPFFTPRGGCMKKFVLSGAAIAMLAFAAPASAQMTPTPQEGEQVTMTATVVDMSCKVVYNLEGEGHRTCSEMCFDQGIPLGLMAEDGTIYLPVTMQMGATRGDKDLRAHAEHTVRVTGKVMDRGGVNAILIESITMAQD
ncbi:MAG: hypothetical protein RQ745_06630 [Longimicrobiales bacterium]|nr:hypothetical protein [Longimicrobiales bacterium]